MSNTHSPKTLNVNTRRNSVSKFTSCDTRRLCAPCLQKTSSAREKIKMVLQKSRTLERQDIDMFQQRLIMEKYVAARKNEWIQSQSPSSFSDQEQLFSLKMIITEAERYQEARGLKLLKNTVLTRAAVALGKMCPKDFMQTTKASSIVINDINLIARLPRNQLPGGMGPNQFAASAVLALPMWLESNKNSGSPVVPSPPRSPSEKNLPPSNNNKNAGNNTPTRPPTRPFYRHSVDTTPENQG